MIGFIGFIQFWYSTCNVYFCHECSKILVLFRNCDFHSIPWAYSTNLFLTAINFPPYLDSSGYPRYSFIPPLSSTLYFKLIYLYEYLSWIFVLSSLCVYLVRSLWFMHLNLLASCPILLLASVSLMACI